MRRLYLHHSVSNRSKFVRPWKYLGKEKNTSRIHYVPRWKKKNISRIDSLNYDTVFIGAWEPEGRNSHDVTPELRPCGSRRRDMYSAFGRMICSGLIGHLGRARWSAWSCIDRSIGVQSIDGPPAYCPLSWCLFFLSPFFLHFNRRLRSTRRCDFETSIAFRKINISITEIDSWSILETMAF